jgi:hypothetical protein
MADHVTERLLNNYVPIDSGIDDEHGAMSALVVGDSAPAPDPPPHSIGFARRSIQR